MQSLLFDMQGEHKIFCTQDIWKYVTQQELIRLFEGDIKTDILNSKYYSISKEHFETKIVFMSYSYQKLQII